MSQLARLSPTAFLFPDLGPPAHSVPRARLPSPTCSQAPGWLLGGRLANREMRFLLLEFVFRLIQEALIEYLLYARHLRGSDVNLKQVSLPRSLFTRR